MKKWFGLCLTISLTASVASAVWPFGPGNQKSVTNEMPSASVPTPRVSPRIFSESPVQEKSAVQLAEPKKSAAHSHSQDCNCSKQNVSTNAASREKKSPNDRSEKDLQNVIQPAGVKKPVTHQHTPECNHSKSNSAVKTTSGGKPSFFDRSEQDLQKVIQSADAGNMKSAYLMWQYYERHQETAKMEQWRKKTIQLAEKEEAFVQQILQRLNKPEEGSVPDNQ
jgi:hypothetical protein